MCDFKPGDEVVCVDAAACRCGCAAQPPVVKGAVYTVASIEPYFWVADVYSLQFDELGHYETAGHIGFPHTRFRKVQKRNDRLTIESFMTIKPNQPEEPKRSPNKKKVEA